MAIACLGGMMRRRFAKTRDLHEGPRRAVLIYRGLS